MKKPIFVEILGVVITGIGAVLSTGSKVLGGILIAIGLLLFFAAWVTWAKKSGGVVCPNCGARIYNNVNTQTEQESNYVSCSECGTLVCVDHSQI